MSRRLWIWLLLSLAAITTGCLWLFSSGVTATIVAPAAGKISGAATFANPHAGYIFTTDKCASCHSAHTSNNKNILPSVPPQSQLCFLCHNGTGADSNVQIDWTDGSVPANDPGTSAFYSHPSNSTSAHTKASLNEFQGVQNRHAECSDCHNSHTLDTSSGNETLSGWTVSGALKNVSGLGVTNGAAGSTPGFTLKISATYEYELCFKCHSSFTNLLSYTPPSQQMMDKAREFNPNNYSFHPVEGAGTNQTPRMAANLAGTSGNKVWNLATTSVIRCTNCHASYRNNTNFSGHSSRYLSILRYNYRDRVLRTSDETYSDSDFALCFTCHANGPFTTTSSDLRSDTNFRYHGKHVREEKGEGVASTDINLSGAGRGLTLCAECHWRLHGNTGTDASNSKRLVNFSPNVEPSSTQDASSSHGPKFILLSEGDPDTGACLLKCHGKDHDTENGTNNYNYRFTGTAPDLTDNRPQGDIRAPDFGSAKPQPVEGAGEVPGPK